MASVPKAPALPWGTSEALDQPTTEKQSVGSREDDLQAVSIDQLGLRLGDRIEVMWHLEQDDGGSMERWWGASIIGAEPSTSGSSGDPMYNIKYDAWLEGDFHTEDEARVALMTDHRLLDVNQAAVMAWRHEGEDYTPPEESEPEEDEDGEAADGGEITVQQLMAICDDTAVAAADAEMMEALEAMEPAKQVQMAAGYRDFLENFKQFVAAKADAAASAEGGLLITTEDVETFKTMMLTQAANRSSRLHRPA